MKEILFQFGLRSDDFHVKPFGSGLINTTWYVNSKAGDAAYILQKINTQVFTRPADIAFNINLVDEYLQQHFPAYLFVSPCSAASGKKYLQVDDDYYRMFPFVNGSHTIDVVEEPGQAYEAALQFARFTKLLSGLDPAALKITLPDFHNLPLRYRQFEEAVENGRPERVEASAALIATIRQQKKILTIYGSVKEKFISRVTHHDTKISNVLLDEQDKGLCVIDLDTVMPGYFISDLGDMMRTYLCPVSEEEKDLSKICIRKEFYDAVVNGYLSVMGAELNETEKEHIPYAGEFMIYMQAIRFLTDHLNGDVYYGAKYAGHNFVRAANQLVLLQRLQEFIAEHGLS